MHRMLSVFIIAALITAGCAMASKKQLFIKDSAESYEAGVILSGKTGKPVPFRELLADLERVQIVYVGEQHTHSEHHKIQLQIIEAFHADDPDLSVGMEMFDTTYQPVLDEWSAGRLDEETFLKRVHWYANWKFDFDLYRDILTFVKDHRIRLVGLNIPFHLPAKIAIGGIDSLSEDDRKHLPEQIDTENADHRAYVKSIFEMHHIKGRDDFETFYTAQCVWEDTMAEAIARHYNGSKMVVLAGNGHIYRKFGIPERAYQRTRVPFRTIYPAPVGSQVTLSEADYIWATAESRKRMPRI